MVTWLEDSNRLDVYNGSSWTRIDGSIPLSTVTTTGDLIVANGNASVTRLGIGSNGQVLQSNGTTATWATPSSTPTYDQWSQLASGTITTGSATFSITGFAAKDNYLLLVKGISGTGAANNFVSIRINGDSSNVSSSYARVTAPGTYNTNVVSNATDELVLGDFSANAGSNISGGVLIRGARATSSSLKLVDFWGAGTASSSNNHVANIGKGFYTASSAVTSIDVRLSGVGNNIDAGTYNLYGSD
jgi:hypothetical protein